MRTVAFYAKWLAAMLREGRGQGHGENYLPWLQLSRRHLPKTSNAPYEYLYPLRRPGHFLSTNEWEVALFLLWSGVDDLREQFPLWPWAHAHPLVGRHDYRGDDGSDACKGLLEIASRYGLKHGVYPGSRIPYVATADFCLTIKTGRSFTCILCAVKPENLFFDDALTARDLNRLALQLKYCEVNKIKFLILSAGLIPETLRSNLADCAPYVVLNCPRINEMSGKFRNIVEGLLQQRFSIGMAKRQACDSLQITRQECDALFWNAVWHRAVSIDPRRSWIDDEPPALTDFKWLRNALGTLLGFDTDAIG